METKRQMEACATFETGQFVANMECEATDVVETTRNDNVLTVSQILGSEIPEEKVFIAQKWLIEKANIASKPVIVAR